MDGWGASMDHFSLLVGMGPEQGILYLRPQRKQGIFALPASRHAHNRNHVSLATMRGLGGPALVNAQRSALEKETKEGR